MKDHLHKRLTFRGVATVNETSAPKSKNEVSASRMSQRNIKSPLEGVDAKIIHLQAVDDQRYEYKAQQENTEPYRDSVCALCEKTVALALDVPLEGLRSRTRSGADIAFARQVAMYLCHTTFSLLLTEVGLHFGRDRTTVSYACGLIEDKRDDLGFDLLLNQLEELLLEARQAMTICGDLPKLGGDKDATPKSSKVHLRSKEGLAFPTGASL